MVLVDVDVAQETDDFQIHHTSGSNYNGAYDYSNATWSYNRFGTGTMDFSGNRAFFLFKGITIPIGSVIDNATLTIKDVENQGANAEMSIRAVNNSAPVSLSNGYTTGGGTLWNTPVLTPAVTFTVTDTQATNFALDVKSHVQALVNAFDYSNDAMMFRMAKTPITTTALQFDLVGFEYQVSPPDSKANLIINYTAGAQILDFTVNALLFHNERQISWIEMELPDGDPPQICVPTSDISNAGGWEDVTLGNNDTELWDELDEVNPDDDTSAVTKTSPTPTTDTFEVKLQSDCIDPQSSLGHVIRGRAKGTTVGEEVKLQLYQGAGLIAESGTFTLSENYKTLEYTLSGGEADSITDYSDLRIRVVPL